MYCKCCDEWPSQEFRVVCTLSLTCTRCSCCWFRPHIPSHLMMTHFSRFVTWPRHLLSERMTILMMTSSSSLFLFNLTIPLLGSLETKTDRQSRGHSTWSSASSFDTQTWRKTRSDVTANKRVQVLGFILAFLWLKRDKKSEGIIHCLAFKRLKQLKTVLFRSIRLCVYIRLWAFVMFCSESAVANLIKGNRISCSFPTKGCDKEAFGLPSLLSFRVRLSDSNALFHFRLFPISSSCCSSFFDFPLLLWQFLHSLS